MTLGKLFNSNYTLTAFYIISSAILLYLSLSAPSYNWDMIGYVGSVKILEIQDKETLHSTTYEGLKDYAPSSNYNELTSGEYRDVLSKDPEAYYQQLPYYQIRVIYIALILLFTTLGINIFLATHLISALSAVIGLWIIFFTFRPIIKKKLMYTLPIFGLSLGLLDIARLSSPDGLTFLTVCIIAYFLIRSKWAIFIILPLSILVRTDLIIFVFLISVYLFFYRKDWRYIALGDFVLCLLIYVFINEYYGHYGWSTVFYFTFIEKLTHPADATIHLSVGDYLKGLSFGVRNAFIDKSFFSYLGITLLSVLLLPKCYTLKLHKNNIFNIIFFTLIISFLYVVVHFLLYPTIWNRFFVGQYILGAAGFLYLLSHNDYE